jgi:hypothetical protein
MSSIRRSGTAVNTKPKRLRPGDGLDGRAEWEAMKGRCRNLSPAAAVRECGYLSEQYRWRFEMPEIDWKKVVTTLTAKKIPFVLTGAHGIAVWLGQPRSTHDVDILVKSGRNYQRAVKAIKTLYPDLEMRLFAGVAAFFVPGEKHSVIDVIYPHRRDIGKTLETAIWIEDHGLKFRIPTLEAALANKYGALLTLTRDSTKRLYDGGDFSAMVKHSLDEGRDPIDLERLAELGELVGPRGGGKEIVELVEKTKAGEVPNLTARKSEPEA